MTARSITNDGTWILKGPLTILEAQTFIDPGFISAIGQSASALFLSQLLERDIPTQRIEVSILPDDRAIIFRVLQRLPEGKVLNQEELGNIPFELGLLTRSV